MGVMNDDILRQNRVTVMTQKVVNHFQCRSCGCAWLIEDFDDLRDARHLLHLHCPACGIRQRLETPPDWRS